MLIYGFGVSSSEGTTREYNEDRYIVIDNAPMPSNCSVIQSWKRINMFAVFDGHGGHSCVDFVKEKIYSEIVNDQSFLEGNFKLAL